MSKQPARHAVWTSTMFGSGKWVGLCILCDWSASASSEGEMRKLAQAHCMDEPNDPPPRLDN